MPLVLGVDEAGYGPNLGPLVIAATAWDVPDPEFAWYEQLADAVGPSLGTAKDRLCLADSKLVYRGAGGWRDLETAALTLAQLAQQSQPVRANDWLGRLVAADSTNCRPFESPVYFDDPHLQIPLVQSPAAIAAHAERVANSLERNGVRLLGVGARIVLPAEFNQLLTTHENKGTVLSACTLQLVERLLDCSREPAFVACDRHGGRAYYAGLLQQFLRLDSVQVVAESPRVSRYLGRQGSRPVAVQFAVGGEADLPTAAASLTAKYVRELLMTNWNRFWQQHAADLQPTAGYPVDARRFLREIEPIRARLQIQTEAVWRNR